ncbi:MAG: 50S ribosomal protein L10 [Nocardioidaceae bacterium]
MARADKAAAVAELTDEFRSSSGAVLTEYRGLIVKQLQELRRALGDHATYAVVKNTLTKIAAKQAGIDGFDALLNGPSAIAFLKGDPVEAAKSLRDFAKVNSPLVIKGGVLDGKPLTVNEIARIADLESREVLLAKLAGAFTASLQGAVFLLNAPLAQAARLVGALQAKAAQDAPSVDAEGTPSEPAVDETPAAPVAEAPDAATADTADMASAEPAVEETAASASATEETSPVPAVEETTSG